MEIVAIIALTLSGMTLSGVLLDKIIQQFQDKKPEGGVTIKSSCCNKKEQNDNHSKDNHSKDRHDVNHR